MAHKKVTIDLNGGDAVTANGDLLFQLHDGDTDAILAECTYAKLGSENTAGSDASVIINITGDVAVLDHVDIGAATSIKYRVKDEAGNESNLSVAKEVSAYVLDAYTGGLAAYSLRKLRSAATNAITIRRSSDNAETTVLLEDTGHISLTSTVSAGGSLSTWVGASSAYVKTWHDQSGNGNDITQATTTLQPLIIASGVLRTSGGFPAPDFDGTDDYLTRAALTELNNGNAFSYFAVCKINTTEAVGNIFTTSNSPNDRVEVICDSRSADNKHLLLRVNSVVEDIDLSTPRVSTTPRLLSMVTDGATFTGYDNAALGGTSTPASVLYNNDLLTMGVRDGTFLPLDGFINELILFSADKTSDRAAIESSINGYYSIY